MFRLFQSLFGRVQTRRRSVRPTRRECYLTLETLEDRYVPATLMVTSGLDNGAAGTLRYEVAQAHSGDIIDILPVTLPCSRAAP